MDNPPLDPAGSSISRNLMRRARQGDREAQDAVFREYAVPLSRLASRLLPSSVRAMTDTQDVVQDVLASTARRLGCIDCDDDGALFAYLRRAVRHRVVDEIRRVMRRPPMSELIDDRPSPDVSPLDAAIRAQNARRTEAALCRLSARDRQAVVLRLRYRLSYEEIGQRLGSPTPNAARVTVRRAVERLTQVLASAERPPRGVRPQAQR